MTNPDAGKVKTEIERAYDAGYDSGKNGPNEMNCHFCHFSTQEQLAAWERGKVAAAKELFLERAKGAT